MTIEEAYRILSNGLINAPSEHEWCVAFKMAQDTMRKYQQIVQIYQKWNGINDFSYKNAMQRIGEVIEDE